LGVSLPMAASNIFKSGDLVPASGAYAVLHSTPHTLILQQDYVEGRRFPRCRLCPLGVWYRLQHQSLPASSDGLSWEKEDLRFGMNSASAALG
jgi:hypothetical protein